MSTMTDSLPESAKDLLIEDGKLLMQSVSVYEILRRFRHILRLTPFRFEDFCAALIAEEQSPLISEVHIQLLKTLIREDRLQQTWLGPPDLRDSINVYLHSVDHSNWPAALKLYLSAEPNENSALLATLNKNNYPFDVDLAQKLDTLNQLCDKFLLSNLAREEIVNGSNGNLKHDTTCRLCSKGNGDIVSCDTCTAVYHLKCSDPPLEDYPQEGAYSCSVCKSNRVRGVTDSVDPDEIGNLKRLDALGEDQFGRRYWFLVRRLFVVDGDEGNVRYYTSAKQFTELLDNLNEDNDGSEESLVVNLKEKREEIERQMQITEDLYQFKLNNFKLEAGGYSMKLGQEGSHKNYTNHYATNNLALSKNQHSDRDTNRSLNNKFSIKSLDSFKWFGAINGHQAVLTITVKTTILKFEAMIPSTFIHPCWSAQRSTWAKSINQSKEPRQLAMALTLLESAIKPVLFKSSWNDAVGFTNLFRSTLLEREETKKTDRLQPRGFERRESYSADFELSYKLGTMVKFSSKLKPVKHQVWKQKGEEYRLTGLNGWSWQSKSYKSRPVAAPKPTIDTKKEFCKPAKKSIFVKPKLPPCHDFLTKRDKVCSLLVLPKIELKKLARSGGLKEAKSFSYTAKQSKEVWPYGMAPRPTFRTCWLYRNRLVNTVQDVSLQLKVLYACIRWEDLQARPPASGQNVIVTDENTITIELLKKRDRLPFLNHSEYLIKKVSTPIEEPASKYRKVGTKKSTTPSARSGLRARRQTIEEEVKGPTTEEVWVPEDQLELWELKQFDEKIERQNQIMRERILREASEKKRKLEEERRMKIELERRQRLEEEAKKARLAQTAAVAAATASANNSSPSLVGFQQALRPSAATTPVIRYFRTEQGQIIRLPASYLERGTPLILRHVGPGPNQTNTYIIRPQVTPAVKLAEPKPEPKPETKLDIKLDSKSESKPEPQQPVAQQQQEQQSLEQQKQPDQKPAEPETKLDLKLEPKPESNSDSKPESKPEPQQPLEQQQQEQPEQKQAHPEPETQPEPQHQSQPEQPDELEKHQQPEQPIDASSVVAQESVGTAVNETAHDQREPSS